MKAKKVHENINFERGKEPKDSLELGDDLHQIMYSLRKRPKYTNFKFSIEGDKLQIRGKNLPFILSGDKEINMDEISQTISGDMEEGYSINNFLKSDDVWVEGDDSAIPASPEDVADDIQFSLEDIEESFDEEWFKKFLWKI